MTNPGEKRADVDSAGVYFISVEDFEARAKPRQAKPTGRDPNEQGVDDPNGGREGDEHDTDTKDASGNPR